MTACEDLATKAELQELRDQLNAVLGEKEEGGVAQIFTAGAPVATTVTQLAGTAYIATKTQAANSIGSILFTDPVSEPIMREFADGRAKWSAVKGSGARVPLPDLSKIGKVAGGAAVAAPVAATAGVAVASSVALLSSLVSIMGTLVLNIATVKILGDRIDAESKGAALQLDAVNTSMLRLYDKQQGDIDAVVANLDANQELVRQNQQAIETTRLEVNRVNEVNSRQDQKIVEANQAIQDLRNTSNSLRQQLAQQQIEIEGFAAGVTGQIETIENNLSQAQEIINQQQGIINQQQEDIARLEARLDELETTIESIETDYQDLRDEFEILKQDIASGEEVQDERLTKLESRLLSDTNRYGSVGGGGGAASAAAVTAQEGVIKVVSKIVEIDYLALGNGTQASSDRNARFNQTLDNLLPQITPGGNLTPEQIQDLQTGITTGVSSDLSSLLGTTFIPRLDTIENQVTDRRIADNVQAGICESLNNPNACSPNGQGGNTTQGLRGMQQGLQTGQQNLTNILNGANALANQSILNIVTNTNNVVNNPNFGLAKIQSYASTAWKVTRADKVMNAVTMAVTVHNGMMLSNNLGATISEALNMSLQALNIRDEEAEPIDIGNAVSGMLQRLITSMIGAENYEALTTRIAKANRIYQSSVNMLHAINDLADSARSVAEMTAEHTGKIGNALRESGAVYEDAYEEFAEKINPQSKAMRNLEKFRGTIEGISEPIETISQMSSEIIEIQENFGQLTEAKNEWKEEVSTLTTTQKEEKDTAKTEVQVTTDIDSNDFEASTEDN